MNKFWKWFLVFLMWLGVGVFILAAIVLILMAINQVLPSGWTITVEILEGLAAMALSATFTFLPFLRTKFAILTSGQKAWVNLISVIIMAVVMYALVCKGWLTVPSLVCTAEAMKAMAIQIGIGLVFNQITYVASTKPSDVINAQAMRDAPSAG